MKHLSAGNLGVERVVRLGVLVLDFALVTGVLFVVRFLTVGSGARFRFLSFVLGHDFFLNKVRFIEIIALNTQKSQNNNRLLKTNFIYS